MTKVDTFLAGQGPASRALYFVVRALVAGFTRLWTRLGVEGREHIPTSGAFVLAPVHRSNMDTPISSCLTRRRLRFMGKDTLWKRQPAAWVLSSLGGFPVTRGTADREALQRCIAVLEAGEPLVLFPEGERKSGPTVQPLFAGAAYVALKAGVPIVPVGIGGSEAVMPKGARFIHPHKVHVIVGEPIQAPPSGTGRVPRAVVRDITAELHATLQRLFDAAEAHAGRTRDALDQADK
jgi:1-acyl-sn-glycerol-3-phosphate acyltransferase